MDGLIFAFLFHPLVNLLVSRLAPERVTRLGQSSYLGLVLCDHKQQVKSSFVFTFWKMHVRNKVCKYV